MRAKSGAPLVPAWLNLAKSVLTVDSDTQSVYNVSQEVIRMSKAKRINITLPQDLIEALDRAAEETNLNRSAFIAVAVTHKIQQDEMMKQLPYIMHKLKEEEAEAKQG